MPGVTLAKAVELSVRPSLGRASAAIDAAEERDPVSVVGAKLFGAVFACRDSSF